MKNIIFALVLAMISSMATAQTDLSQLKQNDKKEYLERLSMEMIKEMAPDYLDGKISQISGPIEFTEETGKEINADEDDIKKHLGKKYYSVEYATKHTFMDLEMDGYIRAKIWEHNGEPFQIRFDLGESWWLLFFDTSYKDFIKTHSPKSYQQHR